MGSPGPSLSSPLDETMVKRLKSHREAASRAAGGGRRETARWATKHLSLFSPGLGLGDRHHNVSGGHVSALAVELPVYHGVASVPGGLTGFPQLEKASLKETR